MGFLQLTLETSKEQAEPCSDALMAVGALSVTFEDAEDQPIFQRAEETIPLWDKVCVTGLFDETVDQDILKTALKNEIEPFIFESLKIQTLADQNWERTWMDRFHPMRFGQTLWVCPSWHHIPDPEAIQIILDPGLAFGTGSHATTKLCLEWLEAFPLKNCFVIDYGCGSGILGIAALKLGARKVIAIDCDKQALISTRDNADRNGYDETSLEIRLPEAQILRDIPAGAEADKADVLIANILADPLISLIETFYGLLKPQGVLVLSGILQPQTSRIIHAFEPWFSVQSIEADQDWMRIVLNKAITLTDVIFSPPI